MPPKKSSLSQLKAAVNQYNNSVSKCQVVLNGRKLDKYESTLVKLEDKFDQLTETWEIYKEEILEKGKSETEFNAMKPAPDDDEGVYKHNDAWKDAKEKAFLELFEKLSDDKPPDSEPKVDTGVNAELQLLCQEIKTQMELTGSNTVKLAEDISRITDATAEETVVERYVQIIHTQRQRLTSGLSDKLRLRMKLPDTGVEISYSKDVLSKHVSDFCSVQLERLDGLEMALVHKVKPRSFSTSGARGSQSHSSTDKVLLAKTKPPTFKGDILDYPEFRRKWLALVQPANLPAEAELDKLRDSVPALAKDQLYGCTTISEAWLILDKRFGNPDLLAKKLKDKLKNISAEGTSDPEKVINLQVKVKTLVMQLSSLKLQDCLKYDSEFLAAVYNSLPSKYQDKWLDVEKSSNKWDDMITFLDKLYDQANEQLVLLSTIETDSGAKKKVAIVEARAVSVQDAENSHDDSDDIEIKKQKDKRKKVRDEIGQCPNCKEDHTFVRRIDKMDWPSDRLFTCKKFKDMSPKDRGTLLESLKACSRCTSWRHSKQRCPGQPVKCSADLPSSQKCGKDHSYLVHDSGVAYCNAARSTVPDRGSPIVDCSESSPSFAGVNIDQETIYYMQDVQVKNTDILARAFYDDGSNRVLIRDEYAAEAGLVKKKVLWKLLVVGKDEPESVEGHMYLAELVDKTGKYWKIWGYGIASIMKAGRPDLTNLKKYFPHVPEAALKGMVDKEVDILIGLNMNHLIPEGGKGKNKHEGMKCKTSLFGCGWVLGGCHGDLDTPSPGLSQHAAVMRVAKIQVIPESFHIDFWEAENMGVLPAPRCDRCIACHETGTCSDRNKLLNEKQLAELDVITEKTQLKDGHIWCDYPYKKDPACLPFNRGAALKVEEKVERDLMRDGLIEVYNEQVQSMLDRGTAVKLSKQEIDDWAGPAHYITHHPVLKDSVTTPVRLVSNSSFGSPSLNSILMKGPNSLNSMLDIMLRWRCWDVALQYDLAKAYPTMRTGLLERHLRRFFWRFSPTDPWEEYAFDRVAFGDLSAGCELEVALHKIADAGMDISTVASEKIKNDRYVDDGLTGGRREIVDKLVGKKQEDGTYDGDLATIFKKGGFSMKAIAVSGQTPNAESDLMGGKVLGYKYDIQNDVLALKFPINLSQKKRNVRTEPNLSLQELDQLKTKKLTKRLLLGVTNGFGDFMGIGSPFTVKFKVLMRNIFQVEEPLHWDDQIPEYMRQAWIDIIAEALEHGQLEFKRSTKPDDAVPGLGPTIVGFSDYAEEAFDARVYLRWKRVSTSPTEELYSASLVLCKAKVPPLVGLTVPRGELTGLCLLSRLVLVVAAALQKLDVKPTSAVLLTDSQCSINAVDTRRRMKPYFQHRVSEIKENMNQTRKYCHVEEIQYVESKLNPSDISTRANCKLADLGPGSFHQLGPIFLSSPRGGWPVSRDFDRRILPEDECKAQDLKVQQAVINKIQVLDLPAYQAVMKISMSRNNLQAVIRILARFNKFFVHNVVEDVTEETKSKVNMDLKNKFPNAYKTVSSLISPEELVAAENLLLEHAMILTNIALEKGQLDSLLPVRDGVIIVTQGRLGEAKMSQLFGIASLPILVSASHIAYLYMLEAHTGELGLVHRGVVSTLARSRQKVWIVKGKRLAKKICQDCMVCKRVTKMRMSQQMALIREEQLQICPPFTHVCLDFAGPLKVKDQVSKRKTLKVWILIYSCVSTKAVMFLATPGYSTEDFLNKHDEFTSRSGIPRTIVSDKGSQLVRGSIKVEEQDKPSNMYDWKHVMSRDSRTRWIFVTAGGQHRNGLAEATVKVMKKSLNLGLQSGEILTYAELVTLLARIATSVNSRPLSISSISSNSEQDDILSPITPNHLLLARSTSEPTKLEYDSEDRFSRRLAFVQSLHDEWWRRWVAEVLPSLVPCKKWKKAMTNLKIGDIVMVNHSNNFTDDYRIAKITKVFPDKKGLVRTVEISFRRKNKKESVSVYRAKPLVTEQVHVQKLSLLQSAGEPVWDGDNSD